MGLALENGNPGENYVLVRRVPYRPRVIQIQQVHRTLAAKAAGRRMSSNGSLCEPPNCASSLQEISGKLN